MKLVLLFALVAMAAAAAAAADVDDIADLRELQSEGFVDTGASPEVLAMVLRFKQYITNAIMEFSNFVNFAGVLNKRSAAIVNNEFLPPQARQALNFAPLGAGAPAKKSA